VTVDVCAAETSHPVIRAHRPEIEGAVSALADAFDGYPWTTWTVPAQDHAQRLRSLFRVTITEIGLPYGEVWITRCPLTSGVVGTAVALRPDREVPAETRQRVATVESELMADRLTAALEADAACRRLRPSEPHVVLATLGVRRDHQGRGVATALLTRVLNLSHGMRVPIYLETSSSANVALYRRYGFSVLSSLSIAGGGPRVWGMVRPVPRERRIDTRN
jgi:ribosomal protein S18 acetylase RimI-like enzyme